MKGKVKKEKENNGQIDYEPGPNYLCPDSPNHGHLRFRQNILQTCFLGTPRFCTLRGLNNRKLFFSVLEVGNLVSSCQQDHASSKCSKEEFLTCLPLASEGCWQFLACLGL